ncbi:hypothetical protein niasHT_019609 [Heterodera trifolii]|uniref:Sm domain-containing protein n=1 Tax=Heterodera trifolii TaxID=157864 RepID=A0ABD2L8D1_9BILA
MSEKKCDGVLPLDSVPSSSHSSEKEPTKMSTKERLRRLQAICKPGKTPLVQKDELRNSRIKRRRVDHLDSAHGKRFACSAGSGVDACLRRWMLQGTRVHVKLRAFSPHQEPNRLLQGAIVAFDKHWNIVLRDVDEVYMPATRLGKVQSMPGAMPQSVRYTDDKSAPKGQRRLLTRHLKCSMVTGTSLIAIYSGDTH